MILGFNAYLSLSISWTEKPHLMFLFYGFCRTSKFEWVSMVLQNLDGCFLFWQLKVITTLIYPFMEQSSAHHLPQNDHIIDIPSSSSHHVLDEEEERPSTASVSHPVTASSSSSVRSNPRTPRRRRSPLNSGLWISIELLLTLGQIIAAIVVLSLSKHEHPRAPLFAWIVGYACGCVATLPLLYWRYYHHSSHPSEQDSAQHHRPNLNVAAGPFAFSISRSSEGGDARQTNNNNTSSRGGSRYPGFISAARYTYMSLRAYVAIIWVFGFGF